MASVSKVVACFFEVEWVFLHTLLLLMINVLGEQRVVVNYGWGSLGDSKTAVHSTFPLLFRHVHNPYVERIIRSYLDDIVRETAGSDVEAYLTKWLYSGVRRIAKRDACAWFDLVAHFGS